MNTEFVAFFDLVELFVNVRFSNASASILHIKARRCVEIQYWSKIIALF